MSITPPPFRKKPVANFSDLAKYSDLFDRLTDSAFLLDTETSQIVDCNASSERTYQVAREGLLGKPFLDWLEEDQRDGFSQALRIAKRRYYPRQVQGWVKLPDGQRRLMDFVVCVLLLSNELQVVQVISKDVTREYEAEEKAKQYLQEIQEANRKLEEMSITDEMTKAYNFRHFKASLQAEHSRASRYKTTYSVIFCDMDNFKHYNDRNGHPAGDELLKHFSKLLRENARTVDLVARYGGEEFVVLCPETDLEGAHVLAERMRAMIASTPFAFAEHQPMGFMSISIGVSNYPLDGDSAQEIVEAADQGVYYSKKNGRNRVTTFQSIKDLPKGEVVKKKAA